MHAEDAEEAAVGRARAREGADRTASALAGDALRFHEAQCKPPDRLRRGRAAASMRVRRKRTRTGRLSTRENERRTAGICRASRDELTHGRVKPFTEAPDGRASRHARRGPQRPTRNRLRGADAGRGTPAGRRQRTRSQRADTGWGTPWPRGARLQLGARHHALEPGPQPRRLQARLRRTRRVKSMKCALVQHDKHRSRTEAGQTWARASRAASSCCRGTMACTNLPRHSSLCRPRCPAPHHTPPQHTPSADAVQPPPPQHTPPPPRFRPGPGGPRRPRREGGKGMGSCRPQRLGSGWARRTSARTRRTAGGVAPTDRERMDQRQG